MGNGIATSGSPVDKEKQLKISHERFANSEIIKGNGEDELLLIKISVPHQKEYTVWAEQLAKIGQQQALFLPKSHNFKKEGFCGLSGVVEITYENYPFLLSDEINNRYCMGRKYFEQSELWYLVLTLLTAGYFFHGKGKKVGDVRPSNVFISEDGSVKVACYLSWPMERTNYQKSFEKQITYISPEEVNELGFGKIDPSSTFSLAETFSIGLTLLDVATLSDSQNIYKNQKSLDYDILETRLKELDEKEEYSRLLRAIIRNMCEVAPQNRTSIQELFEWMSQYENQINNFQQFQPAEIPDKIRAEMDKGSNLKQSVNSFAANGQPTYVGNSYLFQSGKSNTASQPIKVEPTNFAPPFTGSAARNAPVATTAGVTYQSGSSVSAPIGFSTGAQGTSNLGFNTGFGVGGANYPSNAVGYHIGGGNYVSGSNYISGSNYVAGSNYGTSVGNYGASGYQYVSNNNSSNIGVGGLSSTGVAESTYVPYTSKLSLQKIDEQLEQSRKMFPS